MPAAARVRGRGVDFVKPKPRNDVYTILLTISLLALVAGCILLYLDYESYKSKQAPPVSKPNLTAPAASGTATPAPAPAAPGGAGK